MDTDQERGSDSTPMEQRLGRITVSVFYTQNDGQYLLWDTGATVRAIWLCDATKNSWSDGTSDRYDVATDDRDLTVTSS